MYSNGIMYENKYINIFIPCIIYNFSTCNHLPYSVAVVVGEKVIYIPHGDYVYIHIQM